MPSKYNKKRTLKKGGCGCQAQTKISGGGALGPASFLKFDTNTTIPYNTSIGIKGGDPLDPTNLVSTRMQPNIVGGNRKRKSKKQRKTKKIRKSLKKRKYKGGVDYTEMHNANLQSSFFQNSGASSAAHVIHGSNSDILNSQRSFLKSGPLI